MTRRGKIARLPREVRRELNVRLRDGEKGEVLLAWLNGLAEVKAVLAEEFGGAAINHPNLTGWRQGGYGEWLREQEMAELAVVVREEAEKAGVKTDEGTVSRGLSGMLCVQMARTARLLLDETEDVEVRWARLRQVTTEVNAMRRGDHREKRVLLEEERDRLRALHELARSWTTVKPGRSRPE